MSTAVPQVKQSTEALAAFLKGNKVDPTASGGGKPFLQFDAKRTGEWLLGTDKEPVSGEVLALDVTSCMHGWILWHQRKANRRMVPLDQAKPEPQEPVHYTGSKGEPLVDEASEGRSFNASFEDGLEVTYETSTYGGRAAVDALLQELFQRAAKGSPFLYPHIRLDSNSYEHTQYGKQFTPEFTPVAWYDGEGNQDTDTALLEAQPEAEEEPAPEPEPAPRRRRRRAPVKAE